ncbi:hypothetical protein GQ600_21766 [Phytophthora cactorum]|nr:hypothetical protein GQ600_21766 [Phytophthora cactorum]
MLPHEATLLCEALLHHLGVKRLHCSPIDSAAAHGFTQVVQCYVPTVETGVLLLLWTLRQRIDISTPFSVFTILWHAMHYSCHGLAAGHAHISVVIWLHENRTEGCTKQAMDVAAQTGISTFLHHKRTEGCRHMASALAASNGELEMCTG